jgi:dihydropyrimidinase
MEVVGGPAYTLSRGRVVWADGQLRTERGYGKYIDRPCFPSYWQSQQLRNQRAAGAPVERAWPQTA